MSNIPEYLCAFFLLWLTVAEVAWALPVRFYLWVHRCSIGEFLGRDDYPFIQDGDLRLGIGQYDLDSGHKTEGKLVRTYYLIARSGGRALLSAIGCAIVSLLLHSSASLQLSVGGLVLKGGW